MLQLGSTLRLETRDEVGQQEPLPPGAVVSYGVSYGKYPPTLQADWSNDHIFTTPVRCRKWGANAIEGEKASRRHEFRSLYPFQHQLPASAAFLYTCKRSQ